MNTINVEKFDIAAKNPGVQPIHVQRYSADQGPTKISGEKWQ